MSFFLPAWTATAVVGIVLAAATAAPVSAAERQGPIVVAGAAGQGGDADNPNNPNAKKKKKPKGQGQGEDEDEDGQGAGAGGGKPGKKGPPGAGNQQQGGGVPTIKKNVPNPMGDPAPSATTKPKYKYPRKFKKEDGTPGAGGAGGANTLKKSGPPKTGNGKASGVPTTGNGNKGKAGAAGAGQAAGQGGIGATTKTKVGQGKDTSKRLAPLKPTKGVPSKKNETAEVRADRHKKQFEDLKKKRKETVEDGGKVRVIKEVDKRQIIKSGGKTIIRHDESDRFERVYGKRVRHEHRSGGINITIINRPGAEVYTEVDHFGRPLRRWRRYPDGTEVVLFDNRYYYRRYVGRPPIFIEIVELPPPVIIIPRDRYIVEFEDSSDDLLYETLMAPPVDPPDRTYSLEEIRYSRYLRDRMRRLDLNAISFDFGSWEIDPDQYPRIERLARIINRVLEDDPDEMFMIEGHTDAVGDEEDNLSLSDRRAEEVAVVLSETYGVPPENLTTQGYGEQFLKIETDGPAIANRRVSVRRITPLLSREYSEE